MITVIPMLLFFLSYAQTHTESVQLMGSLSHCLGPFSRFSSQSSPHSDDLFLILRNTGFYNRLCLDCYFFQEHHNIAQMKQFLTRLFFLLFIYKNRKSKLQQERYISLSPLNENLLCPHSIISTPAAIQLENLNHTNKILFVLSKKTNNWLEEEGTMGFLPFLFSF